jgi:hypothetical protein
MSAAAASGGAASRGAQQLFAAAEAVAKSRGFRFGDGAEGDILNYAQVAYEKIYERALLTNASERELMREGEHAFEQLVDAMIDGANKIEGYRAKRGDVIGEQTLAWAISQLCPLWPIC